MVDHISNKNLKISSLRNLNEIIVGQLNIDSIRNRFDFPASPGKENIDMHMVLKTKFVKSLPVRQFLMNGYSASFRFEMMMEMGEVLHIRQDIPPKLLSMNQDINRDIEGFFIEIDLLNKKKRFIL